jgi:muconolactone delta-isomerase
MEFLVGFDVTIADGTPESEVRERVSAAAIAAAGLACQGHLVRLWRPPVAPGESKPVGLYRIDGEAELDGLLAALPLDGWMQVTVTPLEPHPNDPASPRPSVFRLPDPRLTPVYRLEVTLGEPVDVGDTGHGCRRIVPLTGGTFTGPTIQGKLLAGASADWQTVLPDGTAVGDIRYTLQTDAGDVLYVQSRGVRHGSTEVCGPPGSRRGRRRQRVHVPHVEPDRDGRH